MPDMAPKTIKQRLQLLEDVFENIPVGIIVIDSSGKVIMMNRRQEKISRVSRDQVVGGYFHEKWERLFDQGIMSEYWHLLRDRKPFQLIVHEVYPQFYDQKISAISRGAPLSDHGGFVLLHEVSPEIQRDRRGLQQLSTELEASRNFLRNLIDSSPNVVITTEETGAITSLNRTGSMVFLYREADLLGKHVSTLFEDPNEFERVAAIASMGRGQEVRCIKKNGMPFPARMQMRNIEGDESRAKLLLFVDLSREKSMEERLALSEKLAVYSELTAGIAHQLNNPLVGVANFAGLLKAQTPPDDPSWELIDTIYEAAQKCRTLLSSMIRNLREAGTDFYPLDLREVLAGALDDARRQEREAGACVHVSESWPESPMMIRGDALHLREAFKNILVNAFQAMPEVGDLSLVIEPNPSVGDVRIRIKDTGEGIPEANQEKVFHPFFTTKKNTGGGLGLSFAFRVIQNHSGRIDVQSGSGQGTTFTVVLPLPVEDEPNENPI